MHLFRGSGDGVATVSLGEVHLLVIPILIQTSYAIRASAGRM